MPDAKPGQEVQELELPIASIGLPAWEMRRRIDTARVGELAQSIQTVGQLHRIGVRPITADTYELIYGERRLRAVTLLGGKTIKATVFHAIGDSKVALAVAAAENLHTETLRTIEAIAIIRAFRNDGFTEQAIARLLAQSEDWLQDHLFVMRDLIARNIAEAGVLADARTLKRFMDFPPAIRNMLLETA